MIGVRPATTGQIAPWSISQYFNKITDQAGRDRYMQAAGMVEQADPLKAEWGRHPGRRHGKLGM